MNKKQLIVSIVALVAIILIIIFTPRYKITWIDSENFIKTEQSSPLYKRSSNKEKFYWDKIGIFSCLIAVTSGFLIFALKEKHG